MKKTLLIIAVLGFSLATYAQTVWNFSDAPYGGNPTVSFAATFTDNGLTLGTDGTALFSMDANNKSLEPYSFTHRLKTGGGGVPAEGSFIPTTRYLSINVSGPSDIDFYMMSSSSSAERILYICNTDESVVDSIVGILGSAIGKYSYNYTGAATKLYFYSKNSGINYYMVSATNLTSGTPFVLSEKGIAYNGTDITNTKGLNIEVYNLLGKNIAKANTSISTANFQKGIYVVKIANSNEVMKIMIN